MILRDLISPLPRAALTGSADCEVSGVKDDSRMLQPGDVFVAVKGHTVDGHDFAGRAVDGGARAIVAETPSPSDLPEGVNWVLVPDSRHALAILSSIWHGNPSSELRLAGVTGTNGKTTTAFLVHWIMKRAMQQAGLIGTVVSDDGLNQEEADFTTPGTLRIQELLRRMCNNGCPGAVLEVSSQGLEQGRADAISFDVAVFTNLSRDHLDYHGTMEQYFDSKRRLFDNVADDLTGKSPVAVINRDDAHGEILTRDYADRVKMITYGFGVDCDFRAGSVMQTPQETQFQLSANGKSYLVRLPLIGRFNVYNALAAARAANAL